MLNIKVNDTYTINLTYFHKINVQHTHIHVHRTSQVHIHVHVHVQALYNLHVHVTVLTLTTSWAAMDPMTACMGDTSPQARQENLASSRSSTSSTCKVKNNVYRQLNSLHIHIHVDKVLSALNFNQVPSVSLNQFLPPQKLMSSFAIFVITWDSNILPYRIMPLPYVHLRNSREG